MPSSLDNKNLHTAAAGLLAVRDLRTRLLEAGIDPAYFPMLNACVEEYEEDQAAALVPFFSQDNCLPMLANDPVPQYHVAYVAEAPHILTA